MAKQLSYKENFLKELTSVIQKLDRKLIEPNNKNNVIEQKKYTVELRQHRRRLITQFHGRLFVPPIKDETILFIGDQIKTVKELYKL